MNKKCFSVNEEDYRTDEFQEYIEDNKLKPGDTVFIADAVHTTPLELFDADAFIDYVKDRAYDDGGEYAEHYLADIEKNAINELDNMISSWLSKYGDITWFYAKNVTSKVLVESDFSEVYLAVVAGIK